ncbi:anti-sigma factor antagonist [Streptomyces sp. NPDC008265]|uniref:STAS domain-containing protein n=1 Tax=Streptomyces sp. NPDC008265 TaxID=3364824 RepID=UPI0036E856AD
MHEARALMGVQETQDDFKKVCHIVRVRGEIDLDHAEDIAAALADAIREAAPHSDIIVDLSTCSFCDSTGLNALLRARADAVEKNVRVRLAAPGHQILRLLELTGALTRFPLDPSAPEPPAV